MYLIWFCRPFVCHPINWKVLLKWGVWKYTSCYIILRNCNILFIFCSSWMLLVRSRIELDNKLLLWKYKSPKRPFKEWKVLKNKKNVFFSSFYTMRSFLVLEGRIWTWNGLYNDRSILTLGTMLTRCGVYARIVSKCLQSDCYQKVPPKNQHFPCSC